MTKSKKILISIVCVFLTGAIALGVAFGLVRSGRIEKNELLESDGGMFIEDGTEESAGEGIVLLVQEIPRESYSEYGVSVAAESAFSVKATITPPEAENNRLNWSFDWQSGKDGSWGEGKDVSEYLSGQASDDTLTYTLQCNRAFGETIILRAEIRGNSKIYKTKSVQYLQGYKDISAEATFQHSESDASLNWNFSGASSTLKFPGYAKTTTTFTRIYGESGSGATSFTIRTGLTDVYTVAATVGDVKAEICASEAYYNAAQNAYGQIDTTANAFVTLGTSSGQNAAIETKISNILLLTDLGGLEFAPFKYNLSLLSEAVLTLRLTATVNGHVHAQEISVIFDRTSFGTFASGIEWENDSDIIMGEE